MNASALAYRALGFFSSARITIASISGVTAASPRDELQHVAVQGDPALLGQLVENLVENAIKCNVAHGWIEVDLHQQGERAILEVSNSGPNIPEDELAGLLEPFRRASQQRVGASNGLGLSIVRTIVPRARRAARARRSARRWAERHGHAAVLRRTRRRAATAQRPATHGRR